MWSSNSRQDEPATLDRTYSERTCDVLIIGAGGAGLRAAIEAKDKGAETLIVCKTLLGKAQRW